MTPTYSRNEDHNLLNRQLREETDRQGGNPYLIKYLEAIKNNENTMKTITVDGTEYVEKGTTLPVMDAVTAPYIIGANYLIRTVTHTYTGNLVWVGEKELVLDTCAWIADSGRWMGAVANGTLDEIEPMGDGKVIGRGAIVDASVVTWKLPTNQK